MSKLRCTLLFISMLLSSQPSWGANLGVMGTVFPIAEIDFLEWVQQRLAYMQRTGQMQQMQEKFQQRVRASALRPKPVQGLSTTATPHAFFVDPTLTLKADIKDHQGRVLYKKGLKINPFDVSTWPHAQAQAPIQYKKHLLFLDADDIRQVKWLESYISNHPHYKIILTNGSHQALNKALFENKGRVYFDQNAVLSQRFHLKHIPSVVKKESMQWLVSEVAIGGGA